MKKGMSLVLALVMCLCLCACGKSEAASNVEELISAIGEVSLESKDAINSAQEAFDALSEDEKAEVENYYMLVESQDTLRKLEEIEVEETKRANGKEAFDNIKCAWTIANQIGTDIYSVWHGWVFEKDDMSSKGLQFFVDKTSLSMDEIVEGFSAKSYVNGQYAKTGITWLEIDEDMKQFYRDGTIDMFEKASRARQYVDMNDALGAIVNCFILNGKYASVNEYLETAKQAMKELPEDYEYYPELKGFFTTASALIDFCRSPSGSLNQFSTLLSDYRKEASEYMNDLDFIFE